MDEQKSEFVRQLEKHIDGLVEKSRSAFSISLYSKLPEGIDSNRIIKIFSVGDTVGINVHEVDRRNTDARLFPCKVLSMKEKDETTFYRVYTAHGILKNHFSVDDLADMRT